MKTLLLSLAALALAGCSTVHQEAVQSHSVGFYVAPKPTQGGYIVDAAFRDRYNALAETYGHKKLENGAPVFVPPIAKDDGIQPLPDGTFFMSKSAMENMVVLNGLKRRGAAP